MTSTDKAYLELHKLIEPQDAEGQLTLGVCTLFGYTGIKRNRRNGFHWIIRSASQKNPTAFFFLWNCHFRGHGTNVDIHEAIRCSRYAIKNHAVWAKGLTTKIFLANNFV
ncbi:1239_t:CDS:2 [Ambispora gerdemannii]|uniref:1239_t:CDS:1 n=1 Tax=Ambispora gerdemannii TaxID=144530 RepID=A0A9N9DIQ9_9GLOM|nr:1239_t:CDS:2 [Ambispora gerdemannii]